MRRGTRGGAKRSKTAGDDAHKTPVSSPVRSTAASAMSPMPTPARCAEKSHSPSDLLCPSPSFPPSTNPRLQKYRAGGALLRGGAGPIHRVTVCSPPCRSRSRVMAHPESPFSGFAKDLPALECTEKMMHTRASSHAPASVSHARLHAILDRAQMNSAPHSPYASPPSPPSLRPRTVDGRSCRGNPISAWQAAGQGTFCCPGAASSQPHPQHPRILYPDAALHLSGGAQLPIGWCSAATLDLTGCRRQTPSASPSHSPGSSDPCPRSGQPFTAFSSSLPALGASPGGAMTPSASASTWFPPEASSG